VTFSWTYSKLKNYETCGKRHYHYDVAKDIKEPETEQLREGNRLHSVFDARLKGKPLPLGFGQYEGLLAKFIAAEGDTYGEQKLALTSEFKPAAWFGPRVWFRTIIDALKVRGDLATVVDWKTGKPSTDTTQLQLMAATLFHQQPALMRVRAALFFVAHEKVEPAEFTRGDLPEIWAEILPRVKRLEAAHQQQEFPPRPSGLCRKYCGVVSCPYHGRGG